MKRIISLLSCLVIVAAFFVVPVSADSDLDGSQLLNLLDYGNAIESETNYMRFNGITSLTYTPPFTGPISYVDVVFRFWSTAGASLEKVSLLRGSEVIGDLRLTYIRGQYYRVSGTVTNRAYGPSFPIGLKFQASGFQNYSYVSIESFNIGSFNATTEVTDSYVELHVNGKTETAFHTDASHAILSWEVTGDNSEGDFSVDLYSYNNWIQFDYIDYTFACMVADITSINVTSNGSAVPFDVSFVESTSMPSSAFFITVRVDQTNVNKTYVGNIPRVQVWGNSHFTDINAITVSSVVGHVKYEAENPVIYWFKKTYSSVVDGFNNVVQAITGDSSEADQAGQNMQDAAGELNNMGEAFDTIETPDIDVGGLTNQFTNFSPSGLTVLATITNNQYVSMLLVLVFTFALCAYVLFGKR